ncbi:MAG: hypothetical protein HY233_13190 [Acidobacteriales bacterium]|nr:hypothetical protein [Terriglobales bacterium]
MAGTGRTCGSQSAPAAPLGHLPDYAELGVLGTSAICWEEGITRDNPELGITETKSKRRKLTKADNRVLPKAYWAALSGAASRPASSTAPQTSSGFTPPNTVIT